MVRFRYTSLMSVLLIPAGLCWVGCQPPQSAVAETGISSEQRAHAQMDSAREAELARLKKLLAQEEAARREAAARADQLAERLKQEEARRNSGMVDPKQAMLNAVYFDYDRSDLRADQQSAMDDNVQRLKEYRPSDMVVVEGHSDTRGTFEYNLALGARRAFAVREYLINAGIDADRIITVSAGASMPADPGNDENAWAKSRRVELKRQSASQEQVSNASDR